VKTTESNKKLKELLKGSNRTTEIYTHGSDKDKEGLKSLLDSLRVQRDKDG